MGTQVVIRDLLLTASIVGFFLYTPPPGGAGFTARAQAQTTAPVASPGAGSPATMVSAQGASLSEASVANPPCADELDAVDAEKNYPGPLLDMAKEDLAACQGKAAP